MPEPQTHVIVGGGLAGAKTAEALRTEGFEGRIVLLAEELEAPYERPPLSKDYLRGESAREQARVHPEGFYADHEIELRTGTSVAEIDTTARRDRARPAASGCATTGCCWRPARARAASTSLARPWTAS